MIQPLFEILLMCDCFDVMLGLSYTHIRFCLYETGNKIGNDGAKAIAEALKTNKTLTTLDLESTYHTPSSLILS